MVRSTDNGTKADSSPFEMRSRSVDTSSGGVEVKYLVCTALEAAGFVNAFSTRIGGVSALPKDALNLGFFKGDPRDNVEENRRRFFDAIGASGARLVTANQTHSTKRFAVHSLDELSTREPECDALLTRLTGVLLAVRTADCLPILIADPVTKAVAAIHAGWRGTAGRIAERTIADLMRDFGVNPRNCVAALGPVACGECYEVGPEVIQRFKTEFGYWKSMLTPKGDGKATLNIRAANSQQLLFCGFSEDRIHTARYCTMHDNDLFFSYRREASNGDVGRLLSVIGRV